MSLLSYITPELYSPPKQQIKSNKTKTFNNHLLYSPQVFLLIKKISITLPKDCLALSLNVYFLSRREMVCLCCCYHLYYISESNFFLNPLKLNWKIIIFTPVCENYFHRILCACI